MATFATFTALGLLLFVLCVAALVWAARSGQWDDLDTPSVRMLVDDEPDAPPEPPHA